MLLEGSEGMVSEDLDQRTFRFACDAYDFCQDLWRDSGMSRHIAYQLFEAAASVGANRAEAKSAHSRREFAAKNAEAKMRGRQPQRLRKEANELVSILTVAVKQLQSPRTT